MIGEKVLTTIATGSNILDLNPVKAQCLHCASVYVCSSIHNIAMNNAVWCLHSDVRYDGLFRDLQEKYITYVVYREFFSYL